MKATVTIEIEIEPARLEPNGPVEKIADGLPDVAAMIEHRLRGAFTHVRGFGPVSVTEIHTS